MPSYGRNFYYSIFGRGKANTKDQRVKDYRKSLQPLSPKERHLFLTSVDYIAHGIRADTTSQSLAIPLEFIVPQEYVKAITRPDRLANSIELDASVNIGDGERFAHPFLREVDKDAINNLTRKQLERLHSSDQFDRFRMAWQAARHHTTPETIQQLENALRDYLNIIASVLSPNQTKRSQVVWIGTYALHGIFNLGVSLLLDFVPGIPDDATTKVVEIIEKQVLGASLPARALEWDEKQRGKGRQMLPEAVDIGENVSMRLRPPTAPSPPG